MSPDSEEPTVNLPSSDDGNGGKKVPETPAFDEEVDDTIVVGGGAPDDGDQLTVVTDVEGDETLAADGDTAAPPSHAAAADPEPGTEAVASHVFANRFEVIALLGEGGMGRVYQVRDRQIEGREVALKVLRPRYSRNARFRDLFFQEIRAAQKFVSEQVNQVRDTGQMDDGRLFLTMDMVIGEDLHALMKREKSLNTRHALEIVRQMLLALQSGHEQGFVHRDVKPPNVMLASQVSKTDDNPYGVGVRLLDFGIAALAAEVGERKVAGTLKYMSPEQANGQRLDARSDLFSVGIVLYEMLSGTRPFEGATLQEISTSLAETQVAPMIKSLDHLKPAVQKILRKALEKDREKRYQSAGEFIEAIESSKAYRVPTGVPGWVGGLLVLSMVAAAGEGAVIYMNQQELRRNSDNVASLNEEHRVEMEKTRSDYDGRLEDKDEHYEGLLADKAKQISKLTSDLLAAGDSEVASQSKQGDLDEMMRELTDATKQIDILRQEIIIERDARLSAEDARLSAEKERNTLRTKVDNLEINALPDAKAAGNFDRMMRAVASGYWEQVVKVQQQGDSDGVYKDLGMGGNEQLAVFGNAAAKLVEYSTEFDGSGKRNKDHLTDALDLANEAFESIGEFANAADGWLSFEEEEGKTPPDRVGLYTNAIEMLKAAVQSRIAEHDQAIASSAESVLTGGPNQLPAVVIAIGEDLDWAGFDPFFGGLVSMLETSEKDGKIDVETLRKFDLLEGWGKHLTGQDCSVPEQYADTIRWFYYAKKWYVDVDEDALPSKPGLENLIQNGSSPKSDWRSVLALQIELSELPGRIVNHSRYYREEKRGKVAWMEELISVDSGSDGDSKRYSWEAERISWDPQRRNPLEVSFTYQNEELSGPGNIQWLDLRDPNAQIVWWIAPGHVQTGNFLNFPTESEVKEFTSRYAAPGLPCLVVVDRNRVERWYSPELGLVFERTRIPSTRELFFR